MVNNHCIDQALNWKFQIEIKLIIVSDLLIFTYKQETNEGDAVEDSIIDDQAWIPKWELRCKSSCERERC